MLSDIKIVIRKTLFLLTDKEKKKIYYLSLFIFLLGITETAGIASVAPFIAIITSPDIIHDNSYFLAFYQKLDMKSTNDFIVVIGIIVLILLFFGNGFSAFVKWRTLHYIAYLGQTLSERLLNKYLNNEYEYFLTRNTSELANIILQEVTRVTMGIILPSIQLFSRSLVTIFIVSLMIVVDPIIACLSFGVLGSIYSLVYYMVRIKLSKISEDISIKRKYRFKIISEAFSGVKEIKIFGKENEVLSDFHRTAKKIADHEAMGQTITTLPRYALEAIVFSGLIIMILILIINGYKLSEILPLITLYAFSGYKLLPAMQEIYTGVTTVKYNLGALDELSNDLGYESVGAIKHCDTIPITTSSTETNSLNLKKTLEMQHVDYKYNGSSELFIKDLSLVINANTIIGFAGETGSGKSTIIDLIAGLLFPLKGIVLVDGVELSKNNIRLWQSSIGYVSQDVYLMDATIAENIAFAVSDSDSEIDYNAVRKAAKLANINEFIEDELLDGYETTVGDRGVRLSGGQKQRIAIARALYHDPKVLILDEATSALDSATESIVIQAVNAIGHSKTIIMIAHRLSTLKQCDQIFVLNKGKIVTRGTYNELINASDTFKLLAGSKSL